MSDNFAYEDGAGHGGSNIIDTLLLFIDTNPFFPYFVLSQGSIESDPIDFAVLFHA